MKKRRGLNRILFWLYEGEGKAPFIFRWTVLVLDFVSIAFFLWEPFVSWGKTLHEGWIVNLNVAIAIYIMLDFLARLYISSDRLKFFRKLHNIADMAVVFSLIAPIFFGNMVFLRVLRVVRILRAFTFLRRLSSVSTWIDHNRIVIDRVTNFVVFLFVMSAAVYMSQVGKPDTDIHSQLDALYYTVTTLTTTGYGDILLRGTGGKILSIIIMILGLTLFLRMVQSLVIQPKVQRACGSCGMEQHEPDSKYCRLCGALLKSGESKHFS